MRRLLLLALLLLCALPSFATIPYCSVVGTGQICLADNDANQGHILCVSGGGSGCTTASINTVGATLMLCAPGSKNGSAFTCADSKSNTWHPLTLCAPSASLPCLSSSGGAYQTQIYYAFNPTTDTTQTFTCGGGGNFPTCFVVILKGTDATSAVFDMGSDQGIATQGLTYANLPYFTPTCDGELIYTLWGTNAGSMTGLAIDSGLDILDQTNGATADYSAQAVWVQPISAPVGASWTMSTGSTGNTASIAAFKPAGCTAAVKPATYPYVPVLQSNESITSPFNACPYLQDVTSGDLLCAAAEWTGGTGSVTPSDTLGTSFTPDLLYLCTAGNCAGTTLALYCGIPTSSGADTVTITQASAADQATHCMEFAPRWTLTADTAVARPYDLAGTLGATSGAVTSPPVAPTLNGEVVLTMITGITGTMAADIPNSSGFFLGGFTNQNLVGPASALATAFTFGGIEGNRGVTWSANTGSGTLAGIVGSVALQSTSTVSFTTPAAGPDGATSQVYRWVPTVTGGAGYYTYSITSGSLPTGLSLNAATGAITGTPSVPCSCSFTLHVTDGTHTANQTTTIKIGTSLNTISLLESVPCATTTTPGCGSLTFTSSVTAGQLIVASGGYGNGSDIHYTPIWYCKDSLGTQFHIFAMGVLGFLTSSEFGSPQIMAGIATSTGSDTVTCLQESALGTIARYSNVQYAQGDNISIQRGVAGSSPSTVTGSLTTIVPNELIYVNGVCFDFGCTMAALSPLNDIGVNTLEQDAAYLYSSTVTGYTLSYTMTDPASMGWFIEAAGFRPSVGGATSSSVPRPRGSMF